MLVRFYKNFRKRGNSTKVPDETVEYKDINVTLKDNTSLHTPVLLLSDQDIVNGYNYMRFADAWYYVNDVVRVSKDLYTVECKKDCLATFKTEIGAQPQYLLRSAEIYNPKVIDNAYPAKCYPTITSQKASMGFTTSGSYMLGVVSGNGVNYYSVTESAFQQLCDAIFAEKQDTLWETIVDAASSITKSFLNVFDYIASCIWMPYAQWGGTSQSIRFGYWDSGINGNYVTKSSVLQQVPIKFNTLSQGDSGRKYLDDIPYTKYELFVPGCGNIPLNHAGIGKYDTITVSYQVGTDGSINGRVLSNNQRIARFTGNVGVQVQISQNGMSWSQITGAIAGIATMAAVLYTGAGGAAGAITSGAGAVSAIENLPPSPSNSGASGTFGIANTFPDMYLTCYQYDVTPYSDRIGHVSLQVSVPGAGYNQVSDPDIPWGDYYEKTEIAGYMRNGFYYE